jgi:hypothetical protein
MFGKSAYWFRSLEHHDTDRADEADDSEDMKSPHPGSTRERAPFVIRHLFGRSAYWFRSLEHHDTDRADEADDSEDMKSPHPGGLVNEHRRHPPHVLQIRVPVLFLRSTMTRIELMRGKTPVFPELTLP